MSATRTFSIRSAQRRPKEFFLISEKAREIVKFIPGSATVEIVTMFLSLTGAFSEHCSSTARNTLSLAAARRTYARLLKAGYVAL
jgi:hypothetical protein